MAAAHRQLISVIWALGLPLRATVRAEDQCRAGRLARTIAPNRRDLSRGRSCAQRLVRGQGWDRGVHHVRWQLAFSRAGRNWPGAGRLVRCLCPGGDHACRGIVMRILLMRSLLLRRSLTAAAAIAVVTACWPGQALAAPGAAGSGQATAAMKVVSYRGYRFEVPRSWPVIRTARHPGMCVRFDVHAVYLGIPGTNQSCPSWLVGTTEAILVEPGALGNGPPTTENPVANQIVATAPRIKVTGTFDTNPTVIYRILASAGLASPVIAAANPARLAAAISGQPGPAGKAGRAASAGSSAAGASNGAPAQADAVSASQEP